MAMAARSPTITTTIKSSIKVKPRTFTAIPSGRERAPIRIPSNRRPYCGLRPRYMQEACLSLGIDPILSHTDSYDQWDAQIGDPLHLAFYKSSGIRPFTFRYLEYQLVVHLEQHLRPHPRLLEGGMDADHRDFDEVGGRSLQRRVGRRALAEGADIEVPVAELRDVPPPTEQRLDEPAVARFLDRAIEPRAHAGKALEVALDERLRLLERDPQLARQRHGALPVDCREIDRLGARPHVRRDLGLFDAEDDGGGLPVDVAAALERGDELRIAGEM